MVHPGTAFTFCIASRQTSAALGVWQLGLMCKLQNLSRPQSSLEVQGWDVGLLPGQCGQDAFCSTCQLSVVYKAACTGCRDSRPETSLRKEISRTASFCSDMHVNEGRKPTGDMALFVPEPFPLDTMQRHPDSALASESLAATLGFVVYCPRACALA